MTSIKHGTICLPILTREYYFLSHIGLSEGPVEEISIQYNIGIKLSRRNFNLKLIQTTFYFIFLNLHAEKYQ